MSLFRYLICVSLVSSLLKAQSGSAFFNASGVFTVPAGVNTITVEVLGTGGRGGFHGGGGGGGGGFAKGVYTVVPNTTLQVTVNNIESSLSIFIKATAGSNGALGDELAFTAAGGSGGQGTGGTIINSSGGNGGMGWPGVFGGGGGGAAGIYGNAKNGENAPAFDPINPNFFAPVAKGGGSAGGVAVTGGSGGGYMMYAAWSYSSVLYPTNGHGYGGGGGGGVPDSSPAYGAPGYCFITWGNSCKVIEPLINMNAYYDATCLGSPRELIIAAYDTVEWYTDTLSTPFAKGRTAMSPPLIQQFDTFYVRNKGCPENRFVAFPVYTIPTVNVIPSFQYTALCWGDLCKLNPSGAMFYSWGPFPGQANVSNTYYYHHTVLKDSLIENYVIGYSDNLQCPDTARVKFLLRPEAELTCTASSDHYCKGDSVTLTAWGPAIVSYTWTDGTNGNQVIVYPETYVWFDVWATDSLGCVVSEDIQLEDRTPRVSVFKEDRPLCSGDSVLLTALGAGSYTWSSGHTSNQVWMKPAVSSQYTVTGSLYGCESTATLNLEVVFCTGMDQIARADGWTFFPNPTSGQITFSGEINSFIKVFSFDGRFIKNIRASVTVDLDLPSGIYLLSGAGISPRKVIVNADAR